MAISYYEDISSLFIVRHIQLKILRKIQAETQARK